MPEPIHRGDEKFPDKVKARWSGTKPVQQQIDELRAKVQGGALIPLELSIEEMEYLLNLLLPDANMGIGNDMHRRLTRMFSAITSCYRLTQEKPSATPYTPPTLEHPGPRVPRIPPHPGEAP